MEDLDKLQDLLHGLVNKSASIQGILKLLEKTELNDKQRELVQKQKLATDESIQIIKKIRESLRN